MGAPSLVSEGVLSVSTAGVISPAISFQEQNDILVVVAQFWGPATAGSAALIPAPDQAGWAQIGAQISQPASGNRDGSIGAWWKRRGGSVENDPIFQRGASWDTGSDTLFAGRLYVIRGCETSGQPYDSAASGPHTSANQAFPAVNVTGLQQLVVIFGSVMDDVALGAAPSGWTAGTALSSSSGTNARFQTYRRTADDDTSADASNATAPTHGCYAWRGAAFVPASIDRTKAVDDSVTMADSVAKASMPTIADSVSPSDAIVKASGVIVSDSTALSDDLTTTAEYEQAVDDLVTMSDSVKKAPSLLILGG